jgi:hypothetical protein
MLLEKYRMGLWSSSLYWYVFSYSVRIFCLISCNNKANTKGEKWVHPTKIMECPLFRNDSEIFYYYQCKLGCCRHC